MIVWRGWGFLVAVFVFGASLAMELVTERLTGNDQFYQGHTWPLALALAAAGIVTWYVGRFLHGRGARTVIDKETGRESTIGGRHAFFFVPMHYWGPLLIAIGIAWFAFR